MSTAPDKGDGAELLLDEARDEARKLIAHPIDEVKRLEHVAADGESAATPLILLTGIGLVLTVVVVVTSALALVLYYSSRYELAFIGVIRVALDCADVCEATARRRDAGDGSRRDRRGD